MQNHVIEVNVAVLWGEHRAVWLVGIWMLLRSILSQMYKGKREQTVEILRGHYFAARFSGNRNPVCTRLPIVWESRMDVPVRAVGPTE